MTSSLPRINPSPAIEKVKLNYPVEELFAHFSSQLNSSILHSSLKTDVGRYSFIGFEPFLVLNSKTQKNTLAYLDVILKTYKINNPTSLPFIGGGIGYFSYDLKDLLEKLPQKAKNDLKLPDMYFVFYQALLIHDNFKPDHVYISIVDFISSAYKRTEELMREVKKTVKSLPKRKVLKYEYKAYKPVLKANFSKSGYMKAVKKAIKYIYAGDIYQVNLSQRFHTKWPYSAYELYSRLNKINPAPFSAYLNFGKFKIISSSPELFLKVANGAIETRPMKGTRPRGKNCKQDQKLKNELAKSVKDGAELSMIVDLERNDLGKISKPGSVVVTEHRRIEAYSTVFQAISIVKGKVDKRTSLVDIIKATFPGGSITGCPKIRAMEIIDELEPTARNIYTGSLGYISFHNTMELNIAIRTMIMKGENIYFQAGGGIVADSKPQAEYQETLDKAYALINSLTINTEKRSQGHRAKDIEKNN